MKRINTVIFTGVLAAAGLMSSEAEAARKKGPLEGEPIVRKKLQLRRFRFQVTPYVAMSLSQPFVHMGYVGARVGIHFADWIGVRAGFGWGVVPVESKLLRAINDGGLPVGVEPGETIAPGIQCPPEQSVNCRPAVEDDNPAPLLHDFRAGLVRAQWQSSIDVVFTPFAGKLGLFSNIFTEYDIYLFGGLGLVGYSRHYDNDESTSDALGLETDPDAPGFCSSPATGQNSECLLHPVSPDTGVKVGGSFGFGLHLFTTDWLAINFEIQDIVTGVNLAGLNNTVRDVPPQVNRDDRDVFHNVTFQLGAKFYIPFKPKRTK